MTDPTAVEVLEPEVEAVDPVEKAVGRLKEKFGDAIQDDTRERFTGHIIPADQLVEIAEYLRDD